MTTTSTLGSQPPGLIPMPARQQFSFARHASAPSGTIQPVTMRSGTVLGGTGGPAVSRAASLGMMNTAGNSPPSSPADYFRLRVLQFLDGLQGATQGNTLHLLRAFAAREASMGEETYRAADIKMLYLGDHDHFGRGLFGLVGDTVALKSSLKPYSREALFTLFRLLANDHNMQFTTALRSCSRADLRRLRLNKHLMHGDRDQQIVAFRIARLLYSGAAGDDFIDLMNGKLEACQIFNQLNAQWVQQHPEVAGPAQRTSATMRPAGVQQGYTTVAAVGPAARPVQAPVVHTATGSAATGGAATTGAAGGRASAVGTTAGGTAGGYTPNLSSAGAGLSTTTGARSFVDVAGDRRPVDSNTASTLVGAAGAPATTAGRSLSAESATTATDTSVTGGATGGITMASGGDQSLSDSTLPLSDDDDAAKRPGIMQRMVNAAAAVKDRILGTAESAADDATVAAEGVATSDEPLPDSNQLYTLHQGDDGQMVLQPLEQDATIHDGANTAALAAGLDAAGLADAPALDTQAAVPANEVPLFTTTTAATTATTAAAASPTSKRSHKKSAGKDELSLWRTYTLDRLTKAAELRRLRRQLQDSQFALRRARQAERSHQAAALLQESIAEQDELRSAMVQRYGDSMPVVEFIDRDLAHLRAQVAALMGYASPDGDSATLLARERELEARVAELQSGLDSLASSKPHIPSGYSEMDKLLDSALLSRATDRQLDELGQLLTRHPNDKTRLRDSLQLINRSRTTVAGS